MAASIYSDSEQATSSLEIHDNSVTLSDPNLLISGDYSRSGSDLVITGSDGARVIVQDYFAGATRPILTSPDGAKITGDVVEALAGPQFPGQYAQATAPDGAKAIGSVATLKGTATATRTDGVKVELKKGDPVFKGDVVETGKGAELGITFVDETVFSLSSDARMVLNELVYQPGGSSNSMLFNLVKGTFGFVSGKIAPSGEMDIQTPVAVMAIRGTAPIVELDINSDGSEVKADAKFFLAVVKGHSGIVHLLDPVTRELLAVLDNPLKGITISGSDGVTTFDLTVADLFFVQTLVQNRIEPLLENLDPEGGPEDLLKKIKNSFDDIFDLLGNTGLGNITLTLSVDGGDGDPLTIAIGIGPGSNPNGVPIAGTININIDVEDNEGGLGDVDAGTGSTNETVIGALPINFGIDGPGTIDFASLSGTTVRDTSGNVVTSGGEVVTYSFSGNTLTASTPSGVVFTVVINDVASGTFTVQFFEPLDEPIGGTEDEITLSLPFRVTDGNGSATTGTLNITVDDDTPEIGTPQDALADEDDLPVGNMDAEPGDDAPVTNGAIDTDSDDTTVAGELNIAFGADDSNAVVNGGTPAGPGDRAVTFATDAVATLVALNLTSEGDALAYAVSPDGTTLTATAGGRTIFTVTLSDTGGGSYVFDLEDTLDHADGTTEDNIDLIFNFTATDSDGDTADSSFTVAVDDDAPVIGTPEDALVDEDDLAGAPNGDLATGNMDTATGDDATVTNATIDTDGDATTVAGSLNISFGADDGNTVVNGGTPSGPGDRAVTFASDAISTLDALNLTSEGDTITYALSTNDTVLTATADGRTIFTVTLSDTGDGSYLFDLVDAIDHPDGLTEDDIDLLFKFTATDSDGDTADGDFTVTVDDDAPIVSGTLTDTVEEEALPAGNEDMADASGNDTDPAPAIGAVATGSLQGIVTVGADEVTTPSGPAQFALSAVTTGLPSLTSNGASVLYDVTGDTLTAFVDGAGGTPGTLDPADTAVFTLQVETDGDYTFTLIGPLDHPSATADATASDEETLALDFSSIIIPTDQDGDAISVASSFTINIIDDVPVIGTTESALVDEDDLAGAANGDLATGNMDTATDDDTPVTNTTVDTDSDETTVGGLLNISFGADDGNAVVDGGAPAAGDRAVTFASDAIATLAALNLTSGGETITYALSSNDTVLTATADGETIFTVSLSDTGSGSYLFDLRGAIDHPSGGSENDVDLVFNFTATDSDGDAVDGSFTVTVDDDVPIANADVDSVAEDGTDDATGNVLTGIDISDSPDANTTDGAADLAGADQPGTVSGVKSVNQTTTGTVGSPLNGEFGTLTLNADGSYVYKLDNGNATVDALDDTETVTDVFEYTLTDADGDSVTTTLTVTVDGTNDAPALSFASSTTSFAENLVNASAQSLVGDATVSDPEGNFDGGTLGITGVLAEDVIGAEDQGSGAGQIGISGNDISFEGTVIGSVGTGTGETGNGENLLITFNADATPAAIEALIEALTYQNSSDTPTTSRVLTMTLTDAGSASDVSALTVNVTEDNDDPSASNLPTGDLLALQGVPKDLNLEDVSFADADLGSGDLTLTFKTVVGTLTAAPPGSSGPVVAGTGTQTVTVTGTIAQIEAYLDTPSSVQYTNTGAPGDDVDTITLELSDNGNTGAGGTSPVTLLTANVDLASPTESFDSLPTGSFSSLTRSGLDYTFTSDGEGGVFVASPTGGIGGSQGLELTSNPPVSGTEAVNITKTNGGAFTFESFEAGVAGPHDAVLVTGFLDGGQVFVSLLSAPPTAGTFTLGPASPTVVDKVEISSLNFSGFVIDNVKVTSFEDPIILDLGASGIDLVSAVDGVRFDLDADGTKDAIGWTNGEDGILVVDLDGSGAIEDGSEVLSPDFADGDFATSLDALASLDDNGDGVIDSNDASYDDLLIWVDANHDGVSQDGELANLLDHGIASIDLNATASNGEINGQRILAEGQYTTTTGETKDFAAVGFEELTIPSDNHAPELTGAHDIAAQDDNAGTPVAELVAGLASDADPGTDIGIAVTAADTSGAGTWQYRSAGGNFVNFPAIALGAAFLLAFDMIVRFVPDADAQTAAPGEPGYLPTPPALTFHAWDGSAGEAGETVDIAATGTGGQTPFSIATATSAVEIEPETAAGPFTDGDDTVDLNEVSPGDDADQVFTNAGAGNDIVILPNTDAPLAEQFSGQTFYGGAGDDIIAGGDGNDLISGGDGDDILAGGLGTDTLIGGEGADSFVISELDAADLIADYDFGAGDEIDLSGLFTVYSDGSAGEGQDDLGDFVRIVDNGDGAVDTLQVDVDGGGDDFVSVASLNADAGVRITYNDDGTAAPTDSGVV